MGARTLAVGRSSVEGHRGPNSVAGKDEAEATVMALVESLGDKYPRSGEASEGLGGTHLGFSPKKKKVTRG